MTTKRDATADLAMCDAATPGPWFVDIVNTTDSESGICYGTPGDTSDTYDLIDAYNVETDYKLMCEAREALPYWLREVERLRGVAEANLAMSADLIAMEGTIKELQFALVNHAQFQRGIECQFCRLSFELGTPDDALAQHAMTCEKSPVVQEVARLRAELSTLKEGTYCAYCGFTVAIDADGSVIADHIGTCEKHPMRAVEAEVSRLRVEANALDRLRAWRKAGTSYRDYDLDGGRYGEQLTLGSVSQDGTTPGKLLVVCGDGEPWSEENPASFAEMVDAALERWSELYEKEKPSQLSQISSQDIQAMLDDPKYPDRLKCARCQHQDHSGDLRWQIAFRCSVCGELRQQ